MIWPFTMLNQCISLPQARVVFALDAYLVSSVSMPVIRVQKINTCAIRPKQTWCEATHRTIPEDQLLRNYNLCHNKGGLLALHNVCVGAAAASFSRDISSLHVFSHHLHCLLCYAKWDEAVKEGIPVLEWCFGFDLPIWRMELLILQLFEARVRAQCCFVHVCVGVITYLVQPQL